MGAELPDELLRYQCQLHLPDWSLDTQKKLQNASVLCIGAGGLAHGALPYLAGAGVGRIGVMDGDTVEPSNLHRQVLFNPEDVGQNKAAVLTRALQQQNPGIEVTAEQEFLSTWNAFHLFEQYDLVIDCSDNFFTRYLVNDVCYFLNKPDVSAAVVGFEGYLSVFSKGKSPCYRCLYAAPPNLGTFKNCGQAGVLGAVPGLFGILQATEAIKLLSGIGEPAYGEVLALNLFESRFAKRTIAKKEDCVLCSLEHPFNELPRYDEYGPVVSDEVTPQELKALLARDSSCVVIDVREPEEREAFHIPSRAIPIGIFQENLPSDLSLDQPIVTYCASGKRSAMAASILKKAGYANVRSLKGGMTLWQDLYSSK